MNITGPIQPNISQTAEKNDLFLRVNQRVAGEILNISNDQVVLSINGVQVVAQMTSSEQLAMLMERRFAYFVVKDIVGKTILLQLAKQELSNQSKTSRLPNINAAILEELGLPINNENMTLVQAALIRGMKITPGLINEMKAILSNIANWGDREAQLAAAIKSAGLPLTVGSLSLAANASKDIGVNYSALLEQLEATYNRQGLPDSIKYIIRYAINSLKEIIIQGSESAIDLETTLMGSIKNLGTSIENEISKLIHPELKDSLSVRIVSTLLALSNLRKEIGNAGLGRLEQTIDNFIEGMRWIHFLNTETDRPTGKGQWTQLDLPLSFGIPTLLGNQSENVYNLKIRIAHDNDQGEGSAVNPHYTRLVIQVDLNHRDVIKVDLSIVSRQIGVEITATNDAICLTASEELSELRTGLSILGYTLKTSRIELGNSFLEMDIHESQKPLHFYSSIDLGV